MNSASFKYYPDRAVISIMCDVEPDPEMSMHPLAAVREGQSFMNLSFEDLRRAAPGVLTIDWMARTASMETMTTLGRGDPFNPSATAPVHPSLEETAAHAANWHAGQRDKAGLPYVGHLMRTVRNLIHLFPDASLAERHAAWLHDVLEDTEVAAEQLARLGYAPEVIAIVRAICRPADGSQSYADWIEQIARDAPLGALRVKIADLTDNADPQRLALLPVSQAKSLGQRYLGALDRLRRALKERPENSDAEDAGSSERIPLTLLVEPVDFGVLCEAAAMADRSVEAFVLEESTGLAHWIVVTGSIHHVELARDRRARNEMLIDQMRQFDADGDATD